MIPGSHNSRIVQGEIAERRRSSKAYYDKGVKLDLEDFQVGEYAYAKPPPNSRGQAWLYDEIVGEEGPRSYVLKMPHGEVRRNRRHIRPVAPPIGEMQVRTLSNVFGSNAAASGPAQFNGAGTSLWDRFKLSSKTNNYNTFRGI